MSQRYAGMLLLLVALGVSLSACAPWPGKPFTEARLYHYNSAAMPALPFIRDGKLNNTITNMPGARLSPDQIERVLAALRTERPRTTILGVSMPQHAIVFYDQQHRAVGVLQLDLLALGYGAKPSSRNFVMQPDFSTIADVCSELRVPPFDRYRAKDYRRNFESMVTPSPPHQ